MAVINTKDGSIHSKILALLSETEPLTMKRIKAECSGGQAKYNFCKELVIRGVAVRRPEGWFLAPGEQQVVSHKEKKVKKAVSGAVASNGVVEDSKTSKTITKTPARLALEKEAGEIGLEINNTWNNKKLKFEIIKLKNSKAVSPGEAADGE